MLSAEGIEFLKTQLHSYNFFSSSPRFLEDLGANYLSVSYGGCARQEASICPLLLVPLDSRRNGEGDLAALGKAAGAWGGL